MAYKKECLYCKSEILMNETLGKWYPLNLDNSPHICEGKKTKGSDYRTGETTPTQEPSRNDFVNRGNE